MSRELTGHDYQEFLDYFDINFPQLRSKFQKEIKWSLHGIPYCVVKPIDINDEDFDTFREIELRWFIKNGIVTEAKNSPLFILANDGQTSVEIETVVSIEKVTDKYTRLEIKHPNGMTKIYQVFGNIEFVKEKLTSKI